MDEQPKREKRRQTNQKSTGQAANCPRIQDPSEWEKKKSYLYAFLFFSPQKLLFYVFSPRNLMFQVQVNLKSKGLCLSISQPQVKELRVFNLTTIQWLSLEAI